MLYTFRNQMFFVFLAFVSHSLVHSKINVGILVCSAIADFSFQQVTK